MTPSFDELLNPDGSYRAGAQGLGEWLSTTNNDTLNGLNEQAANIFYRKGVTFTVYSDANNIERMIPFDIIPRIIELSEWQTIEAGCQQRIRALNHFLDDIYHHQQIIKDGIVPAQYVYASGCYEPWMMNISLAKPIYSHVSGIDLIRDEQGQYRVLEDNLRTPSGVSYMLESRGISESLMGEIYHSMAIKPISDYPQRLKACLTSATDKYDPQIVVLTPGRFNSAYYEHAFLAREMNVPLVHGYDLIVEDNKVYIQGVRGKVQVDVIYRRIDDPFLDPLAFRSDSILGVSGLMSAYRSGNVVITNAPGTGVADDKSMYPYVPAMIEYYLNEKPILPNVETYQCRNPDELGFVLDNLADLVVKETQGSGGYGMLIGPAATKKEIDAYRKRLLDNPEGFIAQPTLALSTCPTVTEDGIEPRHIDLRPFILSHGDGSVDITPGGLTRVAMIKGSLVVNSSQGGGIKDTWVVDTKALPSGQNSADAHLTLTRVSQAILDETYHKKSLILLLSTASCLVWLGRYTERLRHYDNLINRLKNNELTLAEIEHINTHLGFGLEHTGHLQDSAEQLYRCLLAHKIPETTQAIDQNVQEVTGVIGKDSAELYQFIKRLANATKYRAATLQLYACNQSMRQEDATVVLFWRLGRCYEILERHILLQEDWQDASNNFRELVSALPENTRWRELERLANQLAKSQKVVNFWQMRDEFAAILAQGV